MAIIPWPACAFPTKIDWTPPDPPAQENESQWTGRSQITILPTAGKWTAKIDFEVRVDEASSLEMQAFRVAMRGISNTCRVPATVNPQFGQALSVQVDGGSQAGYGLNIKGAPSGLTFKRGHKLTINDQLVMIMAPTVAGSDGRATLTINNPLRQIPADGTAIEVDKPTCLAALADISGGWSQEYPEVFTFGTFAMKERFL